jgi:hypothetical protein
MLGSNSTAELHTQKLHAYLPQGFVFTFLFLKFSFPFRSLSCPDYAYFISMIRMCFDSTDVLCWGYSILLPLI